MRGPVQQSVQVWGESLEIRIYQRSKSVWIAVGEYKGGTVETKGRTLSDAANRWREAARYKGNDGPTPPPHNPSS